MFILDDDTCHLFREDTKVAIAFKVYIFLVHTTHLTVRSKL